MSIRFVAFQLGLLAALALAATVNGGWKWTVLH
jgi:hypothetical protein